MVAYDVSGIRDTLVNTGSEKFPRRDSRPKRRLRENIAMPCVILYSMCIITVFSRSLFLGLESLLGNLGIRTLGFDPGQQIASCTACGKRW